MSVHCGDINSIYIYVLSISYLCFWDDITFIRYAFCGVSSSCEDCEASTYKSVFELPSVAEENVYILSLHYLDRNFADLCTLLFDHWPRQRYSMKVWTLHNNCLAYFTRSSVNLGVIVLAYLTGQKHVCLCVFSVKD